MKIINITLLCALILLLASGAWADTVILYPDTDKNNDMTATGCSDHHDCVNDNDDDTYVGWEGASQAMTEVFTFESFSEDYSTINSVTLRLRGSKTFLFPATIDFGRAGKVGDPPFTWFVCATGDVASCGCDNCPQATDTLSLDTLGWYIFVYSCDPCDSSASWTADMLNNSNVGWGFHSSSSKYKITELNLLVDYEPPVAITGSGGIIEEGDERGTMR